MKLGTVLAAGSLVEQGAKAVPSARQRRETISLNGFWEVAESVGADDRPLRYDRLAPVPGLTTSAKPPFPDVGKFDSADVQIMKRLFQEPFDQKTIDAGGISRQQRNYFWYRTSFTASESRAAATLKVNKAQFGSAVWLNGVLLGTEDSCFTATSYDIAGAVRWGERNELVIRIGAHPKVLPEGNVCNTDFEKNEWAPGIWDDVSVWFDDGPSLLAQQVGSDINKGEALVETVIRNVLPRSVTFKLAHSITALADTKTITGAQSTITLAANETRTVTERIRFPDAALWSPQSPTLYRLHTSTPGDEIITRFGMREFRFDTATRRAYLNGKLIFLRGGNTVLHRFFEDPLCGTLPWNEQWLRKLLGTNPRLMHWNVLKFCVGPVPRVWLDIADELGLLVIYDFPLWTLSPSIIPDHKRKIDAKLLKREYERWLSDSWNHPSIAYWNASNESELPPELSNTIIAEVRKRDLSKRPWANSWNVPEDANDVGDEHPYLFNTPGFDMPMLEDRTGMARSATVPPSGHAVVITEYGWLWLNRDGSPSDFAKGTWASMPYPSATAEERFETGAYLLAGLTEYWRAYRNYAGLLYFTYLGASTKKTFTSDNFANVQTLEFNPHFLEYVPDSFKPLGVYINFWQHRLTPGASRRLDVMMVNDESERNAGTLVLRLEDARGKTLVELTRPYDLTGYGQNTYRFRLELPQHEGRCRLLAIAKPTGSGDAQGTTSRRWVELTSRPAEAPAKDPTKEVKEGQF